MKYVCVDLETTGLDPERCQILEVGMIVVEDGKEIAVFQCFVKHKVIVGEPYALNMNKHIIEKMCSPQAMLTEGEMGIAVRAFLELHFVVGKSIVAAGKNFASFDRKFLDKVVGIPWAHRSIDPATYFLKESDVRPPGLTQCLARAGMDDMVMHDALMDCRQVIALINWGMGKMEGVLGATTSDR